MHTARLSTFRSHIDRFWPASDTEFFSWELGPIVAALPQFRVCRVRPTEYGEPWVYVSVGASAIEVAGATYGAEFLILAQVEDPIHVESLALAAHRQLTTQWQLDLGRVVEIGRPWVDGSPCDHFLVSKPYDFGPALEWCCCAEEGHIRVLWLLPISRSEAQYARDRGVEALEERLEERGIDPTDPFRPSVA